MARFFVTGATGNIGRHLCEILLSQGHGVNALSRDPTSTSAQKLSSLGVTFFKGSFEDEAALQAAAQGCSGVFLNPSPDLTDGDKELRDAKKVIDACKHAGVKTCAYMSVMGAGNHDTWPAWVLEGLMRDYWLGKHAIQEQVKNAGFEHWSITQPPTFMSNYSNALIRVFHPEIIEEPVGVVKSHNSPKTEIALIDPKDLAGFTAKTLLEPARFHKKILLVRSDTKTIDEIAQAISKASGKELRTTYATLEEGDNKRSTDFTIDASRFIDQVEPHFKFEPQETFGVPFTSFEEYLEREKGSVMAAIRNTA